MSVYPSFLPCWSSSSLSFSLSLSRFPKYRRLYLLRWIHILAPQLATRGWTRISRRWLYLGPVGANCDAVGGSAGARVKRETRGIWGTRGEKARRRIEIGINPRKSSGTRPTFDYSCDRSSLSLSFTLLLPSSLFLFFFLSRFPFPLPSRQPFQISPIFYPRFLNVGL